MKEKWNSSSTGEKAALVMKAILIPGMIISTFLYFACRWRLGKDIGWLLLCLSYFVDAAACWKTNHDNAVRSLGLGCLIAPFVLISWLAILLL